MIKIERAVASRLNIMKEPAGILKCGPRCRSMVRTWTIARLLSTPMVVLKRMLLDHNGMILNRVLRSSTSSTVQSFHDLALERLD